MRTNGVSPAPFPYAPRFRTSSCKLEMGPPYRFLAVYVEHDILASETRLVAARMTWLKGLDAETLLSCLREEEGNG